MVGDAQLAPRSGRAADPAPDRHQPGLRLARRASHPGASDAGGPELVRRVRPQAGRSPPPGRRLSLPRARRLRPRARLRRGRHGPLLPQAHRREDRRPHRRPGRPLPALRMPDRRARQPGLPIHPRTLRLHRHLGARRRRDFQERSETAGSQTGSGSSQRTSSPARTHPTQRSSYEPAVREALPRSRAAAARLHGRQTGGGRDGERRSRVAPSAAASRVRASTWQYGPLSDSFRPPPPESVPSSFRFLTRARRTALS